MPAGAAIPAHQRPQPPAAGEPWQTIVCYGPHGAPDF
jgi:hypothetical protein